jgi:hypothetical protein
VSSVLWIDSLRTMNLGLTGETNRLLLGSYSDPDFGTVRAESYAQIASTNVTTVIPDGSIFDSLVLQLNYDFYTYGSIGETVQEFKIHEITEEIDNNKSYFSTSTVAYDPDLLGTQTSAINAEFFNKEFEDTDKDSVISVRIKLDHRYGQRLFAAVDPEDENYTNFLLFKKVFKGLAIIPGFSDKIVGIATANSNTALTLYYHFGDTPLTLKFSISFGINFSKITPDRSSTELAGLNQFFTDFSPVSNRYIQSGTALVTKLDFSKYYEYIDTLSNIIINSAELSIDNVNPEGDFKNPSSLALGLLTDNNRFKALKTKQDSIDYISFGGVVIIGAQGNPNLPFSLFAGNDQGSLLSLPYSKTNNSYGIVYPTLLFQNLFDQKEKTYPYWALMPVNQAFSKSVNRVIFPKDNIKLKLYYTLPFIEPTE